MIKECKECKEKFESTNTKGSEQLYCSKTCRTKSANKRFQENLIKKHNHEKSGVIGNVQSSEQFFKGNSQDTTDENFQRKSNYNFSNDVITCIRETYDARNEVLFYKLKCESLEKEIQELKNDIFELESELENIDSDENDGSGMIGGLVSSFKQDPQTTISFASELISNFIKPKNVKNG
jgi:hypothetical protein